MAGALAGLLRRLVAAGGAIAPSPDTGYTVPFDPELFKLVALELLDEAGVQLLFHAFASDVLRDGPVRGVVFETKSGPVVVRARVVVDCTGDGDVAARAGARYEVGRDEDGLVQPMTLMFRMVQFERAAFEAYVRAHPDQWRGVHGLWDLIRQGERGGRARSAARGHAVLRDAARGGGQRQQHPGHAGARDRRVRLEPRRAGEPPPDAPDRGVPAPLRAGVRATPTSPRAGCTPACARPAGSSATIGSPPRTCSSARKFDDVIARGAYPVDIHNPKGSGTVLKRLPSGAAYDIPLRCLLPRGVDGLLVAGRCLSGSHEAHSSYRVMPIVMATGQAAGVCAALAARRDLTPRAVPVADIQATLIARAPTSAADGDRSSSLDPGVKSWNLAHRQTLRAPAATPLLEGPEDLRRSQPGAGRAGSMEERMAQARAASNDGRDAKEDSTRCAPISTPCGRTSAPS